MGSITIAFDVARLAAWDGVGTESAAREIAASVVKRMEAWAGDDIEVWGDLCLAGDPDAPDDMCEARGSEEDLVADAADELERVFADVVQEGDWGYSAEHVSDLLEVAEASFGSHGFHRDETGRPHSGFLNATFSLSDGTKISWGWGFDVKGGQLVLEDYQVGDCDGDIVIPRGAGYTEDTVLDAIRMTDLPGRDRAVEFIADLIADQEDEIDEGDEEEDEVAEGA